jgi:hypothetical protein
MIPYSLTLQAPKLKELPIPLQVLIPIQWSRTPSLSPLQWGWVSCWLNAQG